MEISELKNTVSDSVSSLDGLNSRMKITEEKISVNLVTMAEMNSTNRDHMVHKSEIFTTRPFTEKVW